MSQDEKNSIYVVVVLIALLALVFSCCCGMLGGLVAGGWQARAVARSAIRHKPFARPPLATPRAPERPEPLPTQPTALPLIPLPPSTGESVPMVPEDFLNSGYAGGAILLEVSGTGPAALAGLRKGDIVLGLGDEDVTSQAVLADLVRQFAPGDTVKVRYWRDGRERSTSVTLDKSPSDPDLAYLGVLYSPVAAEPQAEESD